MLDEWKEGWLEIVTSEIIFNQPGNINFDNYYS